MWKLLVGNPYVSLAVGIALLAALAAAFGGGYYMAVSQAEKNMLTATAEAYTNGTKAQQAYDAGVYKKAQLDFLKRQAANQKRDEVVAAIEKDIPTIVPKVEACTVSAEAMKRLNEVAQPVPADAIKRLNEVAK